MTDPRDPEPADRDAPGPELVGRELTPAERAVLAKLDTDEDLTDADIGVLSRLDDGPLGPDADPDDEDPDCGPPPEWLAMSPGEQRAWLADGLPEDYGDDRASDGDASAPGPVADDVLDAGFTHRGATGGSGFAGGGTQDRMPACWPLAAAADEVWAAGLGKLSDNELVGLICAARRNASRQAALELAAIGELAARRAAPDGTPGEHVGDEVAALLALTGRDAERQVALAAGMIRLPAVAVALAAGRIDADKAEVFVDELLVVDDDLAAAAIAAAVIGDGPDQTTGKLRRELRAQIAMFDAQASAKRKARARRDRRVDMWIDPDGTGAIAGRGLDPAAAILADQNLDADARWLQAHGAPGTVDQLRTEAFISRLLGQPLSSLLPPPATPGGPATPGFPSSWPGALGGSVNLTMPVTAWLGQTDAPGRADRYGTLDAGTCRDLAHTLTASGQRTRWCITLTDPNGRPVAHGCARAGPGPPGSDRAAWLATVTITPIETGTCSHRRETAGYRPSSTLRHIIKIRSPRCGYPGCSRPARRCDDDHTVPYHKGGRTCECNLYPLCRRHHRAKQAAGWHLAQPEPGVLTWTLPNGRTITTRPEAYPG